MYSAFLTVSSIAIPTSTPAIVVQVNSNILETILSIIGSGLLATAISILFQRRQERQHFKYRVLSDFWGYRSTLLGKSDSSGSSSTFFAAQSQIFIAYSKNKKVIDLNQKLSLMIIDKKIPYEGAINDGMMSLIRAMCDDLHVKIDSIEDRVMTQVLYTPKKDEAQESVGN